MVNNVLLHGNLTHDPYYDVVEATGRPFLRFYLAVSLPKGLALALLKGNVAQPPYFDLVGKEKRPFLRIYLAVDRPGRREEKGGRQKADFCRVVAYDDTALFTYPYLRPGSEVVVSGNLRARRRRLGDTKTKTVVEVLADDVTFVRKIDWKAGDAERDRILAERAAGQGPEGSARESEPNGGGFFRVIAYGGLARTSFPYLQAGSEVFVRGRLQARKRQLPDGKRETVVEVVAENVRFLRKINWALGDAERDRIRDEETGR